jgi:hypothetical protein
MTNHHPHLAAHVFTNPHAAADLLVAMFDELADVSLSQVPPDAEPSFGELHKFDSARYMDVSRDLLDSVFTAWNTPATQAKLEAQDKLAERQGAGDLS